ncbi:hypothetical protein PC122_g12032 [Phytophthora cactorum]|nr:hypothetical protein PC122_g12032 [Phytophthora cactorum]
MPTLPEEWNQQCTNHSAARATAEEQDDRTVVSAKDSLADRMETLASTRTHNQGNQCTTKLRREDGEDRTAWRTEGTIDAEMTEATVNDHVQQQHVHEQPAETRTRTSTLISRQGKERHETEERGRSRTPSGVHPRQFGATAESERRAASTSPKRKIPTEWEDITIHKQQLHGARNAKTPRRQGVARQGNHLQAITYLEHSIKIARAAACELKALRKITNGQTTSSEAKDSSGGATPSDTAKQSVEESNAEELIKEEHENKRGADVSHNENPCNEEITDKTTTQGNSAARDQNHDVHD